MKKALIYLLSVLLTLLLIFSYIAVTVSVVVRFQALDSDKVLELVTEQQIGEKVHRSLTQYYTDQENTTGIPLSVYEPHITAEALDGMVRDTVVQGFDYLNGRSTMVSPELDFAALETDIRAFFVSYAEENHFAQDDAFEQAVARSIDSAKARIQQETDVFRFSTIAETGKLKTVQRYVPLAGWLVLISVVLTIILAILLLSLNGGSGGLYWVGVGIIISALLTAVPCIWLTQTRWFDRFAVKSDATFAAVTGYLYGMTHSAVLIAAVSAAAGVLLVVLYGILRGRQHRREMMRRAQH